MDMVNMFLQALAGLDLMESVPKAALWFVVLGGLVGAFMLIYTTITPHSEFKMIREGNDAAALSLCGAFLGFILPLAVTVRQSNSVLTLTVEALFALAIQIIAFFVISAILRGKREQLEKGNVAAGRLFGTMFLGAGILNAAYLISG
ncbi:MAG: DUF350 domain-containing protein [Patescibacteria group bacterium]